MKYYLVLIFMTLTLSVWGTSCSDDDPIPEAGQQIPPGNTDDDDPPVNPGNDNDDDNPMSNNLKIIVGSASFNATLENNAAATAFKALLPMTINMSELNGNEKYFYLSGNLPTASSNPGTIRTGDLMLYGGSCLVLFYETFSTSYSYTRLGHVNNPSGLASALGSSSVNVTFELQ